MNSRTPRMVLKLCCCHDLMDERDSVLEMDYFFFFYCKVSEISVKDKISPRPLPLHTSTQGHTLGKSVCHEPKPRTPAYSRPTLPNRGSLSGFSRDRHNAASLRCEPEADGLGSYLTSHRTASTSMPVRSPDIRPA